MGQEGSQLDLAIHGSSEAGPAVHSCAPVYGDHWGSVATQAQAALQNLLISTQLQEDRREDTVHKHSHFIQQAALRLGAATPSKDMPSLISWTRNSLSTPKGEFSQPPLTPVSPHCPLLTASPLPALQHVTASSF